MEERHGIEERSESFRSKTASICRMLASRLVWVSSTPLGMPSEPLVKRTTAMSEDGAEARLDGFN